MNIVRGLPVAAAVLLGLSAGPAPSAQTAPPGLVPTGQTGYPGQRPRPYPRVTGPETLNPGAWPVHWPYPDQYASTAAASEVHSLRYTDAKVHFVEVSYFAGVHGQMHGHPYASVFAIDAPTPKSVNERLDPDRAPKVSTAQGPNGAAWPICRTMGPESPHAETNLDTWPHHFYRLEYVRLDGADIQKNWKSWYPRMLDAPLTRAMPKMSADTPKFSDAWSYPAAYDSALAAPNNYHLLYEDDHVRLVEVTLRPGETEPMHGSPYPAVIAMDAISGGPEPAVRYLDAKSPLNISGGNNAGPPPEFTSPSCATTGPRAPHSMKNNGTTPLHYYRIEFKRIDGDGLATNWRQWYPWMSTLADETAKSPPRPNY